MTRTERSSYPRAVKKDRSESKTGMDKSLRKDGAGPHNWGALKDELELERAADDDEGLEEEEFEGTEDTPNAAVRPGVDIPADAGTKGGVSTEEVEKARQFRAKGLKENPDLASIARTSAGASTSPPRDTIVEVTRDSATATLSA